MNITSYLPISVIFTILVVHFIADFVFQTPWMAQNKSKSNFALNAHIATYWSILLVLCGAIDGFMFMYYGNNTLVQNFPGFNLLMGWSILNAGIHWCVDYCTSRLSSKQFNKDWHKFFLIIGFDQLIHYFTLFGTYVWIFNN